MNKENFPYYVFGGLFVLLVISFFQSYQIAMLSIDLQNAKSGGVPASITGASVIGTSAGSSGSATLQQILAEITPRGTPKYGAKAGVSYDNVEAGLNKLAGYHSSISLSGNEQNRYIAVATTRGTACEFCCGIGEAGFGTINGGLACGCEHNIAFSGLTKWLIKNTDYNNQQIVDEIQKWKVLFFPEGSVEKELEKRNIAPESVGLQSMVGGC